MASVERTCACCRKPFTAKSADVKRGWALFCSKRCKAIRQTQDQLQHAPHQYDDEADQSWGEHEIYMESR